MSIPKRRGASNKTPAVNRPDPYQLVTELILEHLEKGVVPWRCPWNREVGRPRNFSTGKTYQGVNVVLLGCRQFSESASPWWMTYRQTLERGGQVRKGERGTMVVKYGTFDLKKSATDGAEHEKKTQGRFLRTFIVFNATQIDGIEFPASSAEGSRLTVDQRIKRAEAIVQAMPLRPTIHEGNGERAYYSPKLDKIEIPDFSSFQSPESFYLTLYHELGHASGHLSRLNRPSLTTHDAFGGQVYSQEELVAEMCAAFIGMEADIVEDGHEQSASYLKGWLSVLKVKDHRRWIVQAASQASRAADYILGKSPSEPENLPHNAP